MFSVVNRGQLPGTTEHEIENLNSRLKGLWLTEHNEDGTHNIAAMDFSSLRLQAGNISSGVFATSLIPDLDASKITSGIFASARIPNLDASKITTGTFSSARLPIDVAYIDVANIFTANQRINAGLGVNVAPGATGTISTSGGLFERSRATAIGEYIIPTFSAANFGASSGTWTVASGGVSQFRYTLIGKTMALLFEIAGTIAGATPTFLTIKVPGGFTIATQTRNMIEVINGTNVAASIAFARGSTQQIELYYTVAGGSIAAGPWPLGTSTVLGQIYFEVQ